MFELYVFVDDEVAVRLIWQDFVNIQVPSRFVLVPTSAVIGIHKRTRSAADNHVYSRQLRELMKKIHKQTKHGETKEMCRILLVPGHGNS